MARRRSKMSRNRRMGPGHNEANRQTKESRSRSKLLDGGKEAHFRYDVEQILVHDVGMEPETWRPFLQTLWANGARNGIDDAKDWLKQQAKDGVIDDNARNKILHLIDRASKYR